MGLVIDSSVLIAAERARTPVSMLLRSVRDKSSEHQFLLSSVSVMELEHGWYRAATLERARIRRQYIDEVLEAIPCTSFSSEMGKLAARIDSVTRVAGIVVPTADLLIGVTALYHEFALGTENVRHFQKIPELRVISL